MDFLKSMKNRKKSNSKDTNKKKNKQQASAKKKKSGDKNCSKRSKKHNTKQKSKREKKSAREKKSLREKKSARENTMHDIFDRDTFAFRLEHCVHPDALNRHSVQTEAFETFTTTVTSMGVDGLAKEYLETLVPFLPVGYFERSIFDKNTEFKKNRYKDVPCNDKTRVILKDGYPGDYVHANYVKGTKPMFILTQGPLKDTAMDIWRMVLQEGVAAICMLCELIENGRPKCEPYFPDTEGQVLTFGEITVTCTESTTPDNHTQLKMLTVMDKKSGKSHKLYHYKIITWPDKSIALSNLAILRTLRSLRKMPGPIVVHCSAGIGRTGTFAAIEVGAQCLLNGKAFRPADLVRAVRHCRLNSVQMDTQYLMLVEAILDLGVAFKYIEDPKSLDAIETYKRNVADYVEAHPPPLEMFKAPPKVEIEKEKEKDKDEDDGAQPSSAPVHTPPAPPAIPSPAKLPTAPPPVEKPVTPSPSASPLPSPVSSPAPQLVQKPTTPTDASKPFVAQPPFAPNLGAQTGMQQPSNFNIEKSLYK
ncbi:Tyrosine-protein phosphatase [Caenorhabditis elegans]|uniref:Tyrosine-protein phosphatase n=1 Tax=Caenorhabditis elegans TaxID=6239 RepID=Q20108_CAEEL|nr:Tyrosine-protein phosphatase [Caenorhabditis elegans]CAA92995.3 Tyrosine-protein phosphatase [Caenorhabditis elegans]|eukprot:NP_502058.3 Tyrosine-protein phosphatase [Caenorhabditis elegans]